MTGKNREKEGGRGQVVLHWEDTNLLGGKKGSYPGGEGSDGWGLWKMNVRWNHNELLGPEPEQNGNVNVPVLRPEHRPGAGGPRSHIYDTYEPEMAFLNETFHKSCNDKCKWRVEVEVIVLLGMNSGSTLRNSAWTATLCLCKCACCEQSVPFAGSFQLRYTEISVLLHSPVCISAIPLPTTLHLSDDV